MGIFSFSNGASRKYSGRGKKNRTPLLPETTQRFIANRLTDLAGTFLLGTAAFLTLSLYSYHPLDPSYNTAGRHDDVQNLMGTLGARLSDLLLQTLGLAAWCLVLALAVWGWRVLRRLPFGRIGGRIILLIFSLLAGAVFFARLPSFESWGFGAYLGGAAGGLIFTTLTNSLQSWIGEMAFWFVAGTAFIAFVTSYFLALGISFAEWAAGLARVGAVCTFVFEKISFAWHSFIYWYRTYAGAADDLETAPVKKVRKRAIVTEESMPTPIAKKAPVVAVKTEKVKKTERKESKQKSLPLRSNDEDWQLPPIDYLQEPKDAGDARIDENALHKNAMLLQNTLSDFGVQGDITKVSPGPIVTLYELEPAPGTKTSRVIGLSDDVARSMSAISARVAVVPGKNAIGIELPNARRETVYLRDVLTTAEYDCTSAKLPLILGKNISGDPIVADLARMPHLLVAGTTGSGKSVAVNTMILSLLYKLSPDQCRFIMIDPKMLELSVYDEIPHLITPVVTEPHKAITALKWAVREMEDRYRAMSKLGVRNIDGFNERIRDARAKGEVLMHKIQTGFDPDTGKPVFEEQPIAQVELPYIVIIVDEFADLMLVAGKEVENAIQRLAQMARAAGIHLIMATQRPSVDVITGVIKANFPTRISFQVTSKIDSRTILGEGGAEQLLGQGDMLYMASGGRINRVHGPFVADEEVEKVVTYLRSQGSPVYIDAVTQDQEEENLFGETDGGGAGDALYDQAVAIVLRERKASTSFIQRHLQIGYNRAARIVEMMEKRGVISAANHVGRREVLLEDYGE